MFETVKQLVEYMDDLYENNLVRSQAKQFHNEKAATKRKGDHDNSGGGKRRKTGKSVSFERRDPCKHCGGMHAAPDHECWDKPDKSKDKSGGRYKRDRSDHNKGKNFITKKEFHGEFKKFSNLIIKSINNSSKKKENDSRDDSDDDSELNLNVTRMQLNPKDEESLNDDSSILSEVSENFVEHCHAFNERLRPTKKQKKTHLSCEIVVEIEDRHGTLKPIKALPDTGIFHFVIA